MCLQAHAKNSQKAPNVFKQKLKSLEIQGDLEMQKVHSLLRKLEKPGNGLAPFENPLIDTAMTSIRDYQMAAMTGQAPAGEHPAGPMIRAFTASKHLSFLNGEQMVEAIEKILDRSPANPNEFQIKAQLYKVLLRYERISDPELREQVSQYIAHVERIDHLAEDHQKIMAIVQFDKSLTTIEDYRSKLFSLPMEIQERLQIPVTELRKVAALAQAYDNAGIRGVSVGTEAQEQVLRQFSQFLGTNPYFSMFPSQVRASLIPHLPEMQTVESAVLIIGQAKAPIDPALNEKVMMYSLLSQTRHQMDVGFTVEAPSGLRH
jgi:hypothetical protein